MSKNHILLVEDEAVIALERKLFLQDHDYHVTSVNSGEKAISKAIECSFDLILMDIDLGPNRIDGTEAAMHILSHKDIPILFLTSHAEKSMVEKVKGITRYGYILKNSGNFVLLESINMALELYQEKKRSQEKQRLLEKAVKEKNLILESTREMFAYYDTDLKMIWANQASADSVGKSVQELKGRHCYEIWHQRDLPCDNCPVIKAQITGKPAEGEAQTPDGRIFYLRGYPVIGADGTVEALVEYGTDITNTVKTRRKLSESESLFQEIASHIQEIIYTYDPIKEKFVYVSPVYEKVWERPVAEVYEDPYAVAKSVHPEDGERFFQAVERERRGIEFCNIKYRIICGNGRIKWIWSRNYPVTDHTGKHCRTVGISQEITEFQEKEKILQSIESEYHLLVNHSGEIICIRFNGRVSYVTPSVKRILDYTPEEYARMDRYRMIHPDDVAVFREVMEKSEESRHGGKSRLIYRQKRRDGAYLLLESILETKILKGGDLYSVEVTRDITHLENTLMRENPYGICIEASAGRDTAG
jgi:PAS domain S-box-containing protein